MSDGRRLTATGVIVAITALISLAVTISGYEGDAAIRAGFVPARFSGLLDYGSAWAIPTFLTPLSAALLHSGYLHLGMNMIILLAIAKPTELVLQGRGLLVLYLVGAYFAALAQWLVDTQSIVPMIGASGGVSAVVGAYSLLFGRSRARPIGPLSAQAVHVLWLALAWTAINLLSAVAFLGAGVGVAAAAHVGGFLAGLALAKPLLMWRWRKA